MTEFIFHHGWGLDDSFWNALRPLLSAMPGTTKRILVGHSLGFVHGLCQRTDYDGWIAINSFARFVRTGSSVGCVPAAVLRDMRIRLLADADETLRRFYTLIAATPPTSTPSLDQLRDGLDELRDGDVTEILATLKIPGLVLASRHDPLVPVAASEALHHIAPHNHLIWHETGGHVLPQSDPSWCAQQITSFLNGFIL